MAPAFCLIMHGYIASSTASTQSMGPPGFFEGMHNNNSVLQIVIAIM